MTLRRFLRWSEDQAAAAGLTPAQHQLLVAVKGHSGPEAPAIRDLAEYLLLFVTLAVLTAASAVTAAGFYAGSLGTANAGGWLFVISAAAAWLAGGAMVLEHSFGRSIVPVGKWSKHANVPGAKVTDPIAYPAGMPGVKVGQ